MSWTDLSAAASHRVRGALDLTYLNALKANADYLHDLFRNAHGGIIGGNVYVAALGYGGGSFDAVAMGSAASWSKAEDAQTLTIAQTAGVATVDMSPGYPGANDYAVFASAISAPSLQQTVDSWCAVVEHISATQFKIRTFKYAGNSISAAPPAGFENCTICFAVIGDNRSTLSDFSGYVRLPDADDGFYCIKEWLDVLANNIEILRTRIVADHRIEDGLHTYDTFSAFPSGGGALTYHNVAGQENSREWLLEPWSWGYRAADLKRVEAAYTIDSEEFKAQIAQIAHMQLTYSYGVIACMNPYSHVASEQRLVHPLLYKDAMAFLPRYYDSTIGGLTWTDADAQGHGAPDSLAFLRFNFDKGTATATPDDRFANVDGDTFFPTGAQSGVLRCTILQNQLEELRRFYLLGHDETLFHRRRAPGIIGAGRVVNTTGTTYVVQDWSWIKSTRGTSITISRQTSPIRIRVSFPAAIASYRNVGILLMSTPVAPATPATCIMAQAVRGETGYFEAVQIDPAATPFEWDCSFNFLLFGVM